MKCKGLGRHGDFIEVLSQYFLRDTEKKYEKPTRIAGVERYRYANMLCTKFFQVGVPFRLCYVLELETEQDGV
jgi:hypothetical protein